MYKTLGANVDIEEGFLEKGKEFVGKLAKKGAEIAKETIGGKGWGLADTLVEEGIKKAGEKAGKIIAGEKPSTPEAKQPTAISAGQQVIFTVTPRSIFIYGSIAMMVLLIGWLMLKETRR